MTTNKPEVVATIQSKHGDPESFGKRDLVASTDMQAMTYGTKLIRLSDYERLQAECEKLRKDAERYRWLRADALSAYEDDLDEPQLVYARECVGDYQDCIDAAIDAAMEPPK